MDDEDLERLLSRSELERLRGILEHREDAVLALVGVAGEVLWASLPGTAGVFNRAAVEDFLGAQTRRFVHPADLPAYEGALAVARAGGTARWRGRALDGTNEWVQVRTIMWRAQNGTATVTVTTPVLARD